MSVIVTGNPVQNNVTVTVSNERGPAGIDGGGTTFVALTDAASADLPTINTPLSTALAGKAAIVHTHVVSAITPVASDRLIGRHAGGSGAAQEVTVGSGLEFSGSGIQRAALTGDVTAAAGSNSTTIANDAVGNTKLANMAQATIKGRAAGGGTGDPQDLSATDARTALGLATTDTPTLAGVTLSGTGGSPFTSTLTGGVNFANRTLVLPDVSGTLITLDALQNSATIAASTSVVADTIVLRDNAGQIFVSNMDVSGTTTYASTAAYTYGTGAAAAHRDALGSEATGDALFQAATPAAARETLGIISRVTTANVFATSTTPVDIPQLTFPVEANKLYKIDFGFAMQSSAASGYQVTMNHPNLSRTGNGYSYILHSLNIKLVTLGATSTLLNRDTAGNPNGTMGMTGYAYIRPTASGDVTFTTSHQSAGQTNSIGPLAGSGVLVTEL